MDFTGPPPPSPPPPASGTGGPEELTDQKLDKVYITFWNKVAIWIMDMYSIQMVQSRPTLNDPLVYDIWITYWKSFFQKLNLQFIIWIIYGLVF